MATGDSVQQIKDRLSIIDVISPYVELHKAGKNFKGKSPFTAEKTPSFHVSSERGMYYCFSSSQGGDMFTFVQKMEGVDFKGALKILADRAGVELVQEDPKKRDRRDTLYNAIEEATRFFEKKLTDNKNALDYITDRTVTKETIDKWRIGYAPDEWRSLKEYLNQKGFPDDVLIEAGLAKRAEAGKQPYDVFRDRIMFPIMDPSGRVIAFSGRILKKDTDSPKYVNSPETPLFNKSEALFGYDKAKHGIHKFDFSLIVEGQFDVVLSHQAGYHNAVAVSGTALTNQHLSLLQRLSNRVVLALDSDKAGIAAVKRAAELALSRGIDLKVARIEGGKDPADLVREDPKLLRQSIGKASHVIEFLLNILKAEAKDPRTYKIKTRDEILPYIVSIDSAIERDHFASIVAEAVGTTIDAIRLELARLEEIARQKKEPVSAPTATNKESSPQKISGENRVYKLTSYLAVLASVLPLEERHMLEERFIAICAETAEARCGALSPEELSQLTFTIEQYLAEEKPRYIREDWEGKLAELNSLIIKEKIAKERSSLRKAEADGDEATAALHITEIDTLRSQLHS
ncbi:DNA primase [Candidatus Kaiserbacteria bacterium RIFOXYB1_FULL_46_14]|uniref:DNA primase n=1 Tax=Candidatus Kaiserbacteria bacterium RIFOXYB1_FULL_46_14 TaxID=1798531 RepID=A0A1F6FJN2_9BACT|nr:MAG: DNA primase [Candidatus Kaiserbacteria bacterium RIFOXYB1_FULL_46_14]